MNNNGISMAGSHDARRCSPSVLGALPVWTAPAMGTPTQAWLYVVRLQGVDRSSLLGPLAWASSLGPDGMSAP